MKLITIIPCILVVAVCCSCVQVRTQTVVAEDKTPDLRVTPFLMFTGKATEAMNLYVSTIPNSGIEDIVMYGKDEGGIEGTVKTAVFKLAGQRVMCTDSPPVHKFTFTPSSSMFVDCLDEKQLRKLFKVLSKDGEVMMPINNYGFSKLFGFCSDRFGVSWQLNLPE